MPSGGLLLGCCAVLYAALAVLIGLRARRPMPLLLAVCCAVTAVWAGAAAALPWAAGIDSVPDLLRALAWFAFLFYLYSDASLGKPEHEFGFAAAGLVAAGLGFLGGLLFSAPPAGILSFAIISRLGLAIAELLLIENLYLNLPEDRRWHVALPSVLLGGLACFDIVLCADLVLNHAQSPTLLAARTLGVIGIAPLLIVASGRGQRWRGQVRLSRTAVFHSATLVLSGGVLLGLTAAGEAFRYFNGSWGWFAEASLAFAALIAGGLLLTSASARSRLHRMVVDHFFAERYDYRRQWLACIRTLSDEEGDVQSALPTRVIRTVASVVDSPAGTLLLRNGDQGAFTWAGSWNAPATEAVAPDHPVVEAVRGGGWIAVLDGPVTEPLEGLGPLWLAVPLLKGPGLIGLVLLVPPRAPFPLEQEVFDLLRIVAQEVATYIAEQRATQTLLQTRQLHDYSKRFAFVAHDIKNVSSQLALVLTNAQHHIANPEFQKDMLDTVGSSVRKITALLERLERPEVDRAPGALAPVARLEALVATYRRVRKAALVLEHDGSTGTVAMGMDAFETAVTHLINNAVEAGAPGASIIVRVRHEARQVLVDVTDSGPGMTAEFVRDQLFRPFSTSKAGGSGIGAYQARDLVREAGGELMVISEPGAGTTMRLLLPRTDTPGPALPSRALSGVEA